ncbi:uncharacterized protein [Macrobrachium rosenbergii]|uniref:uncharacterized protein isoform X1 n=1 Tax=Macrobrachium rosenbergii TaxID=79674 RepID=UPI0034D40244
MQLSNVTPTYLTDDDVRLVLQRDKGPEASLISWSLEDLASKHDGFTSVIKNIRVKYSVAGQPGESCYVLKTYLSKGEEADYFYGVIFTKEVNFYTEVIPALNDILREIGCCPLSFPRYFHHRLEKDNSMIILENLKVQAYQMENKAVGIDVDHASLVLKELAKLHAASVLFQERHPERDLVDRFKCLQKEWTQEFNVGCDFGEFVSHFLDIGLAMFEKFGGCEKVIQWIKKIKPDVWGIYNEHLVRTPPFALIVHGDCWINNLLFRYDEDGNPADVKFLDLQGCRKASLAIDLQHFITLNVAGPERRSKLPLLLGTYHAAFDEVMKAGGSGVPFSLEDLRQEYIEKGFYGVLYSVMFLPNMVRRPEDYQDILGTESTSKRSQMENVLKMVDDNPLLKPRVMSVIEEWAEYGLIS